MGSILKPGHIKEGEDVYFECHVKANPKATKLTWYKGVMKQINTFFILSAEDVVINISFSKNRSFSIRLHLFVCVI